MIRRSRPGRAEVLARYALACALACASVTACSMSDAARVARGVPTDLAGTAPPGLGTPPPVPVVAAFDGAYAGTLAPDGANPPGCGAVPDGLSRTMLVENGHATFGVNAPLRGDVAPGGAVTLRYLDVGQVDGRFAGGTFAGLLRTGGSRGAPPCRWAVGLAKAAPGREQSSLEESPAPGPVPGPRSLLDEGLVPEAAPLVRPPGTGACVPPGAPENCR